MFRMQRDDTFLRLMLSCIEQLMVRRWSCILETGCHGVMLGKVSVRANSMTGRVCVHSCSMLLQEQYVLPGVQPAANCFANEPLHRQLYSRCAGPLSLRNDYAPCVLCDALACWRHSTLLCTIVHQNQHINVHDKRGLPH